LTAELFVSVPNQFCICRNGRNGSNTEPYTVLPAEALFANSIGVLVVIFGLVVLTILSNPKWKNPEFENETDRVSMMTFTLRCQN